jgi:hypothetical protein
MVKYIVRIGITTVEGRYHILHEIFASKKQRNEWIKSTEIYKNIDKQDRISYGYEVDGLVYWTMNKSTPMAEVVEAQKHNADTPYYSDAQYHEGVTA